MFTEELIMMVETKIRDKYPNGLKGLISEVYILTVDGQLHSHPYMDKDPMTAQANALTLKLVLAVLNKARKVSGVVQVSSGWIVDGKVNDDVQINPMLCPHRKEILMFNAKGETGTRVRVYEIHKHKGKRLPTKLAGTFESMEKGRE